jgi:hypothetical protein
MSGIPRELDIHSDSLTGEFCVDIIYLSSSTTRIQIRPLHCSDWNS